MKSRFYQHKLSDTWHLVKVDDSNGDLLDRYSWYIKKSKQDSTYYVCCNDRTSGKLVHRKLHREILNINNTQLQVDHKNGIGTDNRKENLRICTQKLNARNRFPNKTMNGNPVKSNYKGVAAITGSPNWQAYINIDGKRKYLGAHPTQEDAAQAYNDAAVKYHGSFAKVNIL